MESADGSASSNIENSDTRKGPASSDHQDVWGRSPSNASVKPRETSNSQDVWGRSPSSAFAESNILPNKTGTEPGRLLEADDLPPYSPHPINTSTSTSSRTVAQDSQIPCHSAGLVSSSSQPPLQTPTEWRKDANGIFTGYGSDYTTVFHYLNRCYSENARIAPYPDNIKYDDMSPKKVAEDINWYILQAGKPVGWDYTWDIAKFYGRQYPDGPGRMSLEDRKSSNVGLPRPNQRGRLCLQLREVFRMLKIGKITGMDGNKKLTDWQGGCRSSSGN